MVGQVRKRRARRTSKKTIEKQIAETSSFPLVEEILSRKKYFVIVVAVLGVFAFSYGIYKAVPYISSTLTVEQPLTIKSFTPDTVVYQSDSKTQTRSGGSLSWRINNPGLIYYGDFAKQNGAIGEVAKYAVFESYKDGRKALETLLFESDRGYKDRSLEDAMKLYAPANEGFNTSFYLSTLRKSTGIPYSRVLSTFTEVERKSLLDTLEQIEKFRSGVVEDK